MSFTAVNRAFRCASVSTAQTYSRQQGSEAWTARKESVLHKMWFSDKTHFWLDDIVRKQNIWLWATAHLHKIQDRQLWWNSLDGPIKPWHNVIILIWKHWLLICICGAKTSYHRFLQLECQCICNGLCSL